MRCWRPPRTTRSRIAWTGCAVGADRLLRHDRGTSATWPDYAAVSLAGVCVEEQLIGYRGFGALRPTGFGDLEARRVVPVQDRVGNPYRWGTRTSPRPRPGPTLSLPQAHYAWTALTSESGIRPQTVSPVSRRERCYARPPPGCPSSPDRPALGNSIGAQLARTRPRAGCIAATERWPGHEWRNVRRPVAGRGAGLAEVDCYMAAWGGRPSRGTGTERWNDQSVSRPLLRLHNTRWPLGRI